MNLQEAKQILSKNGLNIKPARKTLTRFLNDPNVNKLLKQAIRFQKKFNSDLDDEDDPDAYDAFWSDMDDSFFYKLEKAVNMYFGENKITIDVDGIYVKVYTEDDSEYGYRFYTITGEWDNAGSMAPEQDAMIQTPLNFFKTIFFIAINLEDA